MFTCGSVRVVPHAPMLEAATVGWGRLDLTYSVGAAPEGFSHGTFRSIVDEALDVWRGAVPFQFVEQPSGVLTIEAVPGDHDDPFNFGSGELAHAFGPATGGGDFDGQVHINNEKTFGQGSPTEVDLLTVVIHELGHVLGIVEEFPDSQAVMHGSFERGVLRHQLTESDIEAMRALYASLLT